MSGDPSNARLWADADVLVSFDLDAAIPATVADEFGSAWDLVGLLDGDEGFTEARSEDETDHYAWGGVLVRTGRKNFKMTRSFTALEWNATTRRLAYPGSDPGEISVPRYERCLVAFETRDGNTVRRLISAFEAEIVPAGDMTENEADLTKYPFVATIYPDADGVLFLEQYTAAPSA